MNAGKRKAAEKMSLTLQVMTAQLDMLAREIATDLDEQALIEQKRQIGGLMGEIYLSYLQPLWQAYPSLKPVPLGGVYESPEEAIKAIQADLKALLIAQVKGD